MSDLDLAPMDARIAADLAGNAVPLLDHYATDIPALLHEVRMLRVERGFARTLAIMVRALLDAKQPGERLDDPAWMVGLAQTSLDTIERYLARVEGAADE